MKKRTFLYIPLILFFILAMTALVQHSNRALLMLSRTINQSTAIRIPFELQKGINEVLYNHGFHATGTFWCSLYIENKKVDSAKIVFSK